VYLAWLNGQIDGLIGNHGRVSFGKPNDLETRRGHKTVLVRRGFNWLFYG
jgi:hypothetical protein